MTYKHAKCLQCKREFRYPVEYGKVRYCSGHCRLKMEPPCTPGEFKGATKRQYYSKKRRRMMRDGDSIDAYVVFCAFDWECQLCYNEIDPGLQLPHPLAATLEHVIDLSKGGKHEWENVVPAHADCNFGKSQLTG